MRNWSTTASALS